MSIWRVIIFVPVLIALSSCTHLRSSSMQCYFREAEVQYWRRAALDAVHSDAEWARCGGKRIAQGRPRIYYDDDIAFTLDPKKEQQVEVRIRSYSPGIKEGILVKVDLDRLTDLVFSMSEESESWAGQKD